MKKAEKIKIALFCTTSTVQKLALDRDKITNLGKYITYDKVYIETFRALDLTNEKKELADFIVDKKSLRAAIDFFVSKGIEVAGAISTFDIFNPMTDTGFKSLCYSSPEHLKTLERIIEFTCSFFDEILFDDFYFTNCKCGACIEKKGQRTWTTFRLEQLRDVSENIIAKAARRTNPSVKLVLKYPNWYEHYPATGYDLEKSPDIFDSIYTGTETRDSVFTFQNLQKYSGYFLSRYLESIKPGKNAGGWIDAFDCRNNFGDYMFQLFLTLFAKQHEIVLFCIDLLINEHKDFLPIAGNALEQCIPQLEELGLPRGVACYKPINSSGDNYLHGYIGMLGIPLEPSAEYPENCPFVFLTACAAIDTNIIRKMKESLNAGHDICITSGFLQSIQDKGFDEIAEIRVRNVPVGIKRFACSLYETSYSSYHKSETEIVFNQIEYPVNTAVPLISGFYNEGSNPVLLAERYGNGMLYVLNIPLCYGDLYRLPLRIIEETRMIFLKHELVCITETKKVGLFVYDNSTFIVASFSTHNTQMKIIIKQEKVSLLEIPGCNELQGNYDAGTTSFRVTMIPASYKLFRIVKGKENPRNKI